MSESQRLKCVPVRLWTPDGPEAFCFWPEGLARDFKELFNDKKEYDFIKKRVASYNQVLRNGEDVEQDIVLKILHAGVLTKYVEWAARKPPPSIYAHEAAALLGLPWHIFVVVLAFMEEEFGLNFMPVGATHECVRRRSDVRGSRFDPQVSYKTSDIRALDEKLTERNFKRVPRIVAFPVSAMGWRGYLTQAIHNHWANFCRTQHRKNKDIQLDPTTNIVPTTTGYAQGGNNYEATDWESKLVSDIMADDDMLTVVQSLRREFGAAGLEADVMGETEDFVDEKGVKRTRPTAAAQRALELLDVVAEGHASHPSPKDEPDAYFETTNFGDGRTIREAVGVQERRRQRAKARHA